MLNKLGVLLLVSGLGGLVYFGLFFRPAVFQPPRKTMLGTVAVPNGEFPQQVADRVVGILVGIGFLISGTIMVSRAKQDPSQTVEDSRLDV